MGLTFLCGRQTNKISVSGKFLQKNKYLIGWGVMGCAGCVAAGLRPAEQRPGEETRRSLISFDHHTQRFSRLTDVTTKPSVYCDVGPRSLVGFCKLRKSYLDFS